MMRHVWTVYCRRAIIEQGTGTLSLFEIAGELQVVPVAPNNKSSGSEEVSTAKVNSALATLWARREWDTPVKGRMRITMVAPDGDALFATVREVDLREHSMLRMCAKLDRFVVKTSGVYEWVIEHEDDEGTWIEDAGIPVIVKVEDSSD